MHTGFRRPASTGLPAVLLLTFAAGVVAPAPAAAHQGPLQPVKWSLDLEPASGEATAGGRLTAVVSAVIDEGWHVYAPDGSDSGPRPVRVAVVTSAVFATAGELEAPEPQREMDEAFGQITASYADSATFRLPVAIAADAVGGPHVLEVEVSFQACDGKICLPAKSVRVRTTVTVTRHP